MSNAKEYGILLRETREKKGLSLAQVSRDTKITEGILRALESMEKEVFPSETYLHGILKLYARYLSIKEAKIIEVLKMNTIQETPIEFELINIQEKKKKRNQRRLIIYGILLLVITGAVLFFMFYANTENKNQATVLKREEPRSEQETDIPMIEGFSELYFSLGEERYLVNNDMRAILKIESIVPPIIKVNEKSINIELNKPVPLYFDQDDVPEYLLLLRLIDLTQKQLLLRLDPRVLQSNINSLISISDQEEKILSDGPVIEIESMFFRKPIEMQLAFNNFSYYKIVTETTHIEEKTVEEGDEVQTILEEPFRLYVANDTFVTITVNGKVLEYEKTGLPKVFLLTWRQQEEEYTLVAIPLP